MMIGNPPSVICRSGCHTERFCHWGEVSPFQSHGYVCNGERNGCALLGRLVAPYPDYHVLTVSPGATAGTAAPTAKAMPSHFEVMLPVMMPRMQCMGVFHSLDIFGTERYVRAVQGDMAKFAAALVNKTMAVGIKAPPCW